MLHMDPLRRGKTAMMRLLFYCLSECFDKLNRLRNERLAKGQYTDAADDMRLK